MILRINQRVKGITTLGPGVRYGLWIQGCERECPGCISPEAQSSSGGYELTVEELAREILEEEEIEGITISGGEPFLQQEALAELISLIRREKDLGVIAYTGFSYPQIALTALAQSCDAIVDGPYIQEKDDGKGLRGSSNQRLILLTQRYRDSFRIGTPGRQVKLYQSQEGGTVLVGIPSKGQIAFGRGIQRYLGEGDS